MAVNLSLELERGPRAPHRARRAFEAACGDLDAGTRADARLLVSELVTNGLKYGGVGPVRLEVTLTDERLRAEVIDQGQGFEPRKRSADLEDVGGWGLPLVEHLADRWGTYRGSTHVWFEIELA
jgi:anti-sigma regulatory factor (Ser/Thr protein kinase)